MNNEELSQRIQRLFVSEENKKRLLKELENLNEKGVKQLSGLVREHDKEAIKILDEKKEELGEVSKRIQEAIPAPESAQNQDSVQGEEITDREMVKVIEDLKEAFQDPKKLATLISEADDKMLSMIEEVMLASLENSKEGQKQCTEFFQEVRLQKEAFVQADKKEQKEMMADAVDTQHGLNERLDQIIVKAEKMLGKSYQKRES